MKTEFIADLLYNTLKNEPEIPLFLGFFTTEFDEKEKIKLKEIPERQKVEFGPLEKGFIKNKNQLIFQLNSKSCKLTHFGIFDVEGNLLLKKTVGLVINLAEGERMSIDIGYLNLFIGKK